MATQYQNDKTHRRLSKKDKVSPPFYSTVIKTMVSYKGGHIETGCVLSPSNIQIYFFNNRFSISVNFSSNTSSASSIGCLDVISTPAFFNTSIG